MELHQGLSEAAAIYVTPGLSWKSPIKSWFPAWLPPGRPKGCFCSPASASLTLPSLVYSVSFCLPGSKRNPPLSLPCSGFGPRVASLRKT